MMTVWFLVVVGWGGLLLTFELCAGVYKRFHEGFYRGIIFSGAGDDADKRWGTGNVVFLEHCEEVCCE